MPRDPVCAPLLIADQRLDALARFAGRCWIDRWRRMQFCIHHGEVGGGLIRCSDQGSTGAGASGVSVMLLLLLKRCYFRDDGLIFCFRFRAIKHCQFSLAFEQGCKCCLIGGSRRIGRPTIS